MAAAEARIPVSKDVRQRIRFIKAREDRETYNETLAALVEAYEHRDV